jgi:hypothetical protein
MVRQPTSRRLYRRYDVAILLGAAYLVMRILLLLFFAAKLKAFPDSL